MGLTNEASKINNLCGKIQNVNKKLTSILNINDIPNILVVSANGGTPYSTITDAINHIKKNETPSDLNRFVIYVAPGVYRENISLPSYVDLIGFGDGSVITPEDTSIPVITIDSFTIVEDVRIIV